MGIEDKITDIVKRLSYFDNWEDRYRQILSYAKKLEPMDEEFKVDEKLVRGCLSKVWVHYEFKDGKLHFQADSEAAITKGIIAILVKVYTDQTPQEILAHNPDFLAQVGITEHLSMNRRNGLANMVKVIQSAAEQHLN